MSEAAIEPTLEQQLYGAGKTTEESDTEEGTPDEAVESAEGDGALATEDADNEESDTEDGTPDDEESEGDGYEQRFKDTQAKLTETSQALADLKQEYANQVGELTETGMQLQDKLAEVESTAQFYATIAQQDLAQLRQVNVQQLNQEQYAQWQQQVGLAERRFGMLQQRLDAVKRQSHQVKEDAITRAAKISRAQLVRSIDNFDEAYPEIGKFAVSQGVDPRVFKEITDPGLIKIIHGYMQATAQPDAIEKVVSQTQAKRKMPTARRPQKPAPQTLAEKLYGSN